MSIYLDNLDLDSIADSGDKFRECEFFFNLASTEKDRSRFRWLISAYLNAVYAYFETAAVSACVGFNHPQTGSPIEDSDTIAKLEKYINVSQSKKRLNFVKTAGLHPTIVDIYKLRNATTHRCSLEIMIAGPNLPEDFHLGRTKGKGSPLLALCREALLLIEDIQSRIDA